MKCRHCNEPLTLQLVDLGTSPPSNAYLTQNQLNAPERWYPLRVLVCEHCWLVQTEDFTDAQMLFDDEYAYFSSFSQHWLKHSESYAQNMIARFALDKNNHVVEIAANDGYLLQYFKAQNIPCTGVEPTKSTAKAAKDKGLNIIEDFFGVRLAQSMVEQSLQADLIAANNVLAHVPDINDFVAGFTILLTPHGVATFEFPHLVELIDKNQFDTIYHEHFSYLSLTAVQHIFERNGLQIFDVESLTTHGGSLRVFAQRADTKYHAVGQSVPDLLAYEKQIGVTSPSYYEGFQSKVIRIKNDFLRFLMEAYSNHKTVVAYGAAAKGNTLMNYAGVRNDMVACVADRNPAKQDKYMPGSRIPIVSEARIEELKPDYVLILPWNLKAEVTDQLSYIQAWGGQFVVAIPELTIIPS